MFIFTLHIKNVVMYLFTRDFAYVARDKSTRKHMCHVFRCDTPARQIANALRDICKKIMTERRIQQNAVAQRLSRPTDLPNLEKNGRAGGEKVAFPAVLSSMFFLCRQRSIAAHRDHFVRRLSVCYMCICNWHFLKAIHVLTFTF